VNRPPTFLGVDPDVIPAVSLGEIFACGREPHGNTFGELFAEALGAELLDQVAHPRRPAVLPVPELAEDLGYASSRGRQISGTFSILIQFICTSWRVIRSRKLLPKCGLGTGPRAKSAAIFPTTWSARASGRRQGL
jgi:hypothetical protein